MGFGTYDESEQGKHNQDVELEEDEGEKPGDDYDGDIDFEYDFEEASSNEEVIDEMIGQLDEEAS